MERLLHEPDIDIYAVFGIVQILTMKTKFSRERAEEWNKLLDSTEEAMDQAFGKLESIKRASEVARIQRQTAPTTANAERRSQRRHKLALDQVDVAGASAACAERRIKAAEAEYLAASVEYNDIWMKYKSRYRTQASAIGAGYCVEMSRVSEQGHASLSCVFGFERV